jgi:hypothetical protein
MSLSCLSCVVPIGMSARFYDCWRQLARNLDICLIVLGASMNKRYMLALNIGWHNLVQRAFFADSLILKRKELVK